MDPLGNNAPEDFSHRSPKRLGLQNFNIEVKNTAALPEYNNFKEIHAQYLSSGHVEGNLHRKFLLEILFYFFFACKFPNPNCRCGQQSPLRARVKCETTEETYDVIS